MPESMTKDSLIADLKLMLGEATNEFETNTSPGSNASYKRMIEVAVADMHRVIPRKLRAVLPLVPEQLVYPAPEGIIQFSSSSWGSGRRGIRPWSPSYIRSQMPVCFLEPGVEPILFFDPPPSAAQISQYGSEYSFSYKARHTWEENGITTVLETSRDSLLLRCLVEAVRTIAVSKLGKSSPVKVSFGGVRQGEPANLYRELLREWIYSR